MKYFSDFQYDVDPEEIAKTLSELSSSFPGMPEREDLQFLFNVLDLTSLNETDNADSIGKVCDQINLLTESYPELPSPAAFCIYPDLVAIARAKLNNPLVNIVSAGGGFPSSQTFIEVKLKEIEMLVEAGVDEVDIVLPVGKFMLGLYDEVFSEIYMIKEELGALLLKVIIETSSHNSLSDIRKASLLAMDAGADFIKTSTGKAAGGAEPESFLVMCQSIRDFYSKTGKKVGIKPAGGISNIESAFIFSQIVKNVL